MPAPLQIVVRGSGRTFAVAEDARLTAGRVAQCEIHLDDHSVSRRHFTIEARGPELVVTDLDSANGTEWDV